MYNAISLASRRRDIEAAEKHLLQCGTEEAAVQHLLDTKPSYLRCGYEQWIDIKDVKDNLKKFSTKIKIHGYEDRAERFQYLCAVLSIKWEAKPAAYKSLMKFLLEMSKRPTEILNLTVGTEKYTDEPEEYNEKEYLKSEPLEELKRIVLQELREDYIETHYSTDSDLSDWQLSDSESEDIVNAAEEPKLRHSHKLSSLRCPDYSKPLSDSESTKKDLELYWRDQEVSAEKYISENIRKIELTPLNSQPVISSLIALFSKFGEFWEWKKRSLSHEKLPQYIILEDDIIWELLWQFAKPDASNSTLFTPEWKPKQDILLSSLSRLSLHSSMNKYGRLLQKLEVLLKFRNAVENNSSIDQPRTYNIYAQSLSEILAFISSRTDEIRRNRRIKNTLIDGSTNQPCTTLIQLDNQRQDVFTIISTLECLHVNSIARQNLDSQLDPAWFSSVKLISSLEMHLNIETRPRLFGLTLFVFSECLLAFLDELFMPLETLVWTDSHYFFKRDPKVTLNDSNFWDSCITCQPVSEKLVKEGNGILLLSCLEVLLPKILDMLKVLEMLRILGEDFTVVLGKLPSPRKIVQKFLDELLPPEKESRGGRKEINSEEILIPDYATHFKFLGLEDLFVIDSFKYVMDQEIASASKQVDSYKTKTSRLERFLSLETLPFKTPNRILGTVLIKTLDPYFKATQSSLKLIFKEHRVDEIIKLFREIVLGEREDFAQDISKLANSDHSSKLDDTECKDSRFQMLLEKYYPEGRDDFDIQFISNPASSLRYKIVVTPHFPLNLILSSKSIDAYLFIARQLHRIRKSLWSLNCLHMKNCRTIETIEPNRLLLLRFSLIHLCSSLRAFFLLKIFSKDLSISSEHENLDSLLKAHETYLCGMECEVLQNRAIDALVISKLVSMSLSVCKHWSSGLSLMTVIKMEDTLKKCWTFLGDYSAGHYSREYNELAYHIGPPPEYL